MSFLTPLYVAGLLAVSLPLLFHLIRRTPKGKLPFSSLMFLAPSPPRLTRRSRLDNILLLILRGLALVLLALAFARPFWREAANLSLDAADGRRMAILLDTSASMRRDGVWKDAKAEAERLIADLTAVDQLALFTFDEAVQTLVSFEDSAEVEFDSRMAIATSQLKQAAPTWAATNLDNALVTVADALDQLGDAQSAEAGAKLQIVLITDLQQGSRLDALSAYEWPKDVQLEIKIVGPPQTTNASFALVTDGDQSEQPSDQLRVRVTNQPDSASETFELRWAGPQAESADNPAKPVGVYVPPGESRVVKVSLPAAGIAADRLVLSGDDHDFDNTLFVAPQVQQEITILYLGSEQSDDAQELRYYLEIAFPETRRRKVVVTSLQTAAPLLADPTATVALVVVSESVAADRLDQLRRYLRGGGTVLFALKDVSAADALAKLMERGELRVTEASPESYRMLGDIDFGHPLFATFSDPRFSDFTKIHFWKYRQLEIDQQAAVEVLARFDNGDPALVEQPIGHGRLLVLSSGWHPRDSELARSTKFVPLLDAMLRRSGATDVMLATYHVNQRVALPPVAATPSAPSVFSPNGSEILIATEDRTFSGTEVPGIYHLSNAGTRQPFAVNLVAAESRTAPLEASELEQRGVLLGTQLTTAEEIDRRRQLRDTELERSQKLWRWLIAAALVVLLVETWLAGRLSRHRSTEVQPTGAVT
jgi:hypothetical protein